MASSKNRRKLAVEDYYGPKCPPKHGVSGHHIFVPRDGIKVCVHCGKTKGVLEATTGEQL